MKEWLRARRSLFRWWIHKQPDRFWSFVADRIPRRLAYFAAIRVGVHATVGRWSSQVVPELTIGDMLKRWDETG